MKNPLVSVIMPAYNAQDYIGEAIQSILDQTFKDFELIILDDASTDDTWKIINDYETKDGRIFAVRNEENLYIARNRNKGISLSKGKYIVWQDADDISKPNRIEKLVRFMEENTNVGICGSCFQSFNEKGLLDVRTYATDDFSLRKNIFKFSPVSQPTAIVRKECFDKLGLFDPEYPPAEDIEFSFRLGEKYEFGNVAEVLLMYREHLSSATYTRTRKQIKLTLKVRGKYLRNKHYNAGILDYLAYIATWISQFLPSKFVVGTFKLLRKVFNVKK